MRLKIKDKKMNFFKGFLYGIAFFFAGYLALTYRQELQLYFSGISKLPVVRKLSFNFQTGIQLFSKDFKSKLLHYQESKAFSLSTIPNSDQPWAWKRTLIEKKLTEQLGARQAAKRQLFLDYIERYAALAMSEMAQSQIPASLTLAQGILETNAGDSYIARAANNHFGIKCYKYPDYKADGLIDDRDFYHHRLAYGCVQIKDDHPWDRFQRYESVQLSFRHHSLLLSQEARYNWMIRAYAAKIGTNIQVEKQWFGEEEVPYFAAWCIGLKKSGYATGKYYAQKLALIIETYELWRFDYQLVMA